MSEYDEIVSGKKDESESTELGAVGIPLDSKKGKAQTEKTRKRSGACPAYTPRGTRCKICQKVHS